MKEKTFKNYWAIVRNNYPFTFSIRTTKRDCIKEFLSGTEMTWQQAKKRGWKCVKVDVTIKESE